MSGAVTPGSGAMFDGIAARYDLLNRVNSLGLDRGWRRRAARAAGLFPGARVLDLATGTADLAIELARLGPGASITGLDASVRMLELGRQKLRARGLAEQVELRHGDAAALPFGEAVFDRVTIAFGIRNMPDRGRVLAEIRRVLRPGGRVVVLELVVPRASRSGARRLLERPFAAIARLHVEALVPRIGAWLSGAPEYRHLERSIAAFPTSERFVPELVAAGLRVREVEPLTFGAAVLFVADRPEEEPR